MKITAKLSLCVCARARACPYFCVCACAAECGIQEVSLASTFWTLQSHAQ